MNKLLAFPNTNAVEAFAQQLKLISSAAELDTPQATTVLDVFVSELPTILASHTLLEQLLTLAFYVITQTNDKTVITKYITKIIDAISADKSTNILGKISFLIFAYNYIEETNPLRFNIFTALAALVVTLPASTPLSNYDNIDTIIASITKDNIAAWGLSDIDTALVYKNVYNVAIDITSATAYSVRSQLANALTAITKAYVANNADEKVLALGRVIAAEAITLSLSLPSKDISLDQYISYDLLLANQFITAVTAQGVDAALVNLLDIHLNSTLAQIDEYVISDAFFSTCDTYNLDAEAVRTNLIALAVAGSIQTAGVSFTYQQLSNLFNTTNDDQIDEYLVEATAHGQITAKINSLDKVVFISRCIPRKFNKDTCLGVVAQRLKQWKSALDAINNVSAQ